MAHAGEERGARHAGGEVNAKKDEYRTEVVLHLSTGRSSTRGRRPITGASAIERAIEVLTDVSELVQMQANNPLLNSMRSFRLGRAIEEPVPEIDRYVLGRLELAVTCKGPNFTLGYSETIST